MLSALAACTSRVRTCQTCFWYTQVDVTDAVLAQQQAQALRRNEAILLMDMLPRQVNALRHRLAQLVSDNAFKRILTETPRKALPGPYGINMHMRACANRAG